MSKNETLIEAAMRGETEWSESMTSIPETIPDDIRVAALEIAYCWAMPDEETLDLATQAIAAALLAERRAQIERDAAIVAVEAADQEQAPGDEWHIKMARYLRRIERAIRAQLK